MALRKVDVRMTVRKLSLQIKVTEATVLRWKAQYGGMQVSEVRWLSCLTAPVARLGR